MESALQMLFLSEAEMQCRFIMRSGEDFYAARTRVDNERMWLAAQGILSSAANLSKLCWGSGSDPEQSAEIENRRAPLREGIALADASPLKARSVRNKFEHWDNYLLEWYRQDHTDFAARAVLPAHIARDRISWPGGVEPKYFGLLDPIYCTVRFWNVTTSLPDLIREAEDLLPRIQSRYETLLSEARSTSGSGQEQSPSET